MTNKKGSAAVTIIVILAVIIVAAIAVVLSRMYVHATEIRFDYVESHQMVIVEDEDFEQMKKDGYGFKRPFFGNSANLNEDGGSSYSIPLGPAGDVAMENMAVYDVVNGTILDYGYDLNEIYKNNFRLSYEVQNDGELLTVIFTGEAFPDGLENESIPLEKTFKFSIKDASTENLPQLVYES